MAKNGGLGMSPVILLGGWGSPGGWNNGWSASGIALSNATFPAGSAAGVAIGTLSAITGTGTYTFTLTDSAGSKVALGGTNGVNLQTGATSATAGSFSITVHADGGTPPYDQTFLITAVLLFNTVLPVISGTVQQGSVLSTTNGTWSGAPTISYSYQWQRNAVNIAGAGAATYTLAAADVGTTITVAVTATNAGGAASITSLGVGPVVSAPVAPVNTSPPTISGSAVVGETLVTTTGTWIGSPSSTFTYQWKRDATSVGTNSSSYTLVTADLNAVMTCVVTGTNTAGSVDATSNSLGPVGVAPSNTVLPTISDTTPTVGDVLTATTGTWTGSATITYSYQWRRAGGNIGGATNNTYTVLAADYGLQLSVVVTATNGAGSTSAGSLNTVSVAGLPPANAGGAALPVISGTATEGQILTVTSPGTWTGAPTPTFSYQWKRGATNVGTNSTGYTLVTADIAAVMTCVVTGSNAGGSANATSNSKGPVLASGTTTQTPTIDLVGSSDFGPSAVDNITSDNTPQFDVVCLTTPLVGDIIDITKDGTITASATLTANDIQVPRRRVLVPRRCQMAPTYSPRGTPMRERRVRSRLGYPLRSTLSRQY